MAFTDDDLHAHMLEEFGMNLTDGDVWLEQAEAARQYEQQRKAKRVAWSAASGTCLDCYAPAVEGKRRCARCLKRRTQNQMNYLHRGANDPLPEEARRVIAESAARRRR